MACHWPQFPLRWPRCSTDVSRLSADRHPHAIRGLSGRAQERECRRRDLHRGAVPLHRDHHWRGAELTRPLATLVAFALVLGSGDSAIAQKRKTDADRYDATFKKYSKRYFGI